MIKSFSIEDLEWWRSPEPTSEELFLSGGLQVEDWPHARHVETLAIQIFKATQDLHRLNVQSQRLLARAALLHNTGMMVESRRHHKHSFRLIKATQLPDMTETERHEVACIARYHRRALPTVEHEEFAILSPSARKRVSMLAALVRIADALDYNHDNRVLYIEVEPDLCNSKIWTLRLRKRPLADLDDEMEQVYAKADLFEQIFKRKLRLVVQ